jgi:hypothetical protein
MIHLEELFEVLHSQPTFGHLAIYWQSNVSKVILPLLQDAPYVCPTFPDRHGYLSDSYNLLQNRLIKKIVQSEEWNRQQAFYNIAYPYLVIEIRRNNSNSTSTLNLLLNVDLVLEHFLNGVLPVSFFYVPIISRYVSTFYHEMTSLSSVSNTVLPICMHSMPQEATVTQSFTSTPLFSHQVEGLQWLQHMEKLINDGEPVGLLESLVPFPSTQYEGVFWDPVSHSLSFLDDRNSTKLPLYSRGGMVGDGIGSGKTLLMLSLIMSDIYKTQQQSQQHRRSTFTHASVSRATLVVCGKQLATQWQQQIKQHFGHLSLKVVLIMGKSQHELCSLEQILTADLVIVSMSFLCGTYYRDQCIKQRITPDIAPLSIYRGFLLTLGHDKGVILENIHFRRLILDEADMYLYKLQYADPELEHHYQRRLTQHCRVNSSRTTEPFIYMQCLSADFRWIVTSTANFSDLLQQAAFVSFLGLSVGQPQVLHQSPQLLLATPRTLQPLQPLSLDRALVGPSPLERVLVKNAFSHHLLLARSQKQIFQSMSLPPVDVDIIWVEYSDAERNLVRGALEMNTEYNFQRHVHAFPLQVSEQHEAEDAGTGLEAKAMSVQEASEVLMGSQRRRLLELESVIELCRPNLQEVERVLATSTEVLVNVLNYRHLQLTNEITNAETSMSVIRRSMQFLEASLNNTDPCSICMDAMTSVITKCGHKFCATCLERSIQERPRCPTCRSPCALSQCIPLLETDSPAAVAQSAPDYGSRFRALLAYFRDVRSTDPTAQFLVFSEWDKELQKQSTLLTAEGFMCSQIKGNTSVCQHVVKQFQDGILDVLFISLQSMASGLHLANANHVIILTPLGAPFDRAEQVERQAIGRCHRIGQTKAVHVRHMLVRNTLEEDIWRARQPQTQECEEKKI